MSIVRRLDDLGRIVIPTEIRNKLGLESGSPIDICVDLVEEKIILVPYVEEEHRKQRLVEQFIKVYGEMESGEQQEILKALVDDLRME